jgi:acetolactate synthase-1/2/3 large subunit
MNGFEVATAAAEGIPIVLFVFNDRRLGMVEHGHRTVYGREASYPIQMDVGSLAHGLGATFHRVDRPGQLAALRDALRAPTGPVVVDVLIDPDVRMPTRDRMITIDATRSIKMVN